ncbi:site-2 protease family protein [Halobaculum sp. MBLA0147]|uniref:site-2 protease family protein n=1 Tax=Halobaculum sp. MBLA0147 TaxID=3079934 RepID=UPI00352552CE
MNTLLLVLAGVLAYSAAATALSSRGYLPDAVRVQGPLTTIHTKRGRRFLEWLATPRRFWRAWSNLGVGIALVVMAGMFLFLVQAALGTVRNPSPSIANEPSNFLIVPGVNDFLPLAVAPEIAAGLLIALVVHEGGHGLLCRVEDIDIDSMGAVFFTLVPVGAFVEPEEESQRAADRGARNRMFAAGVTNNFAVTILAFGLLFGPVIGAISVAPGVAVAGIYPGTAADDAGLAAGDRITGIDGQPVANTSEMEAALSAADSPTVTVEIDGEERRELERRVVAFGSAPDNPANLTVDPEESAIEVYSVNGTAVRTEAAFERAAAEHELARLNTSAGERIVPLGASLPRVAPDGPLGTTSDDLANASVVVTRVGGDRVVGSEALRETLGAYEPGDSVDVRVYADGRFETYTVTLGEDRTGAATLGQADRGTSGVVVGDVGIRIYPAQTYLGLLGGESGSQPLSGIVDSTLGLVYVALILPLAGSVGLLEYNFAGFYGDVAGFYDVTGPLGAFGETPLFLTANLLFWTAWINLQLGMFNCIPGYPLDGGRILRMLSEGVVSRLPVGDRHTLVRTVTTSVGLVMLAALLVIMFGPRLLA